jgi:hypothetical protein
MSMHVGNCSVRVRQVCIMDWFNFILNVKLVICAFTAKPHNCQFIANFAERDRDMSLLSFYSNIHQTFISVYAISNDSSVISCYSHVKRKEYFMFLKISLSQELCRSVDKDDNYIPVPWLHLGPVLLLILPA